MEIKFTVKQARKYAGFTQLEVSKRMGIDRGTYIRLEKNPGSMTIDQARTFSQITSIPYDSIFFVNDSTLSRGEEP